MVVTLLVILVILAFLVWLEVIPVRKWCYIVIVHATGKAYRLFVDLISCVHAVEDWLNRQ